MLLRSLLIAVLVTSNSMACEVTPLQLQNDALSVLQRVYPEKQFTRGKRVDVIEMGEVEFGLQNLYATICVANPALKPAEMGGVIRAHFQSMMLQLKTQESNVPNAWIDAKDHLLPQLMPSDYVRSLKAIGLMTRPFVPGVELGIVFDQKSGYQYVRHEDGVRWKLNHEEIYQVALDNLIRIKGDIQLQGGDGDNRFLGLEQKDGYDAVSILIPWVQKEAAKFLGDPFFVSISNRDFLMMWSRKNDSGFQSFTRTQAKKDFESQPYPLSRTTLLVWADGKIETVK